MPSSHANNLCEFSASTPELTQEAIDAALAARSDWEQVPWQDRASIFLRVRSPSPSPRCFSRLWHDQQLTHT